MFYYYDLFVSLNIYYNSYRYSFLSFKTFSLNIDFDISTYKFFFLLSPLKKCYLKRNSYFKLKVFFFTTFRLQV